MCQEGTDKRQLFSLNVLNLLSSSILQVEQQKLTGFFPLFKFCGCIILFTFLYIWLILFMTKGAFVGENCGISWQFSLRVS